MKDSQVHLPDKVHVQDLKDREHYYKSQWLCVFLSKVWTGIEMEGTSQGGERLAAEMRAVFGDRSCLPAMTMLEGHALSTIPLT